MKTFLISVVYDDVSFGHGYPTYRYSVNESNLIKFLNDCNLRQDRLLEKYFYNFINVNRTVDIVRPDIVVKSKAIYDNTKISPQVTYNGKTCKVENFTLEPKIRLVRFNYYGGSQYGGERIVKITDENDRHYIGTDLVKNETRNYLKNKIGNFKELL